MAKPLLTDRARCIQAMRAAGLHPNQMAHVLQDAGLDALRQLLPRTSPVIARTLLVLVLLVLVLLLLLVLSVWAAHDAELPFCCPFLDR